MTTLLSQVVTASEADSLWNLPKGSVKRDIHRNKFMPGEFRKSKGIILIMKEAIYRMYGEPRK